MNADILKRVVRAIADGSQNDLDRLADKIVEAERRTGHKRLADQLEAILKQPRKRVNGHKPTGDIDRKLTELPLSRRNAESLATLLPTESLEHHMVLPTATEERFARIECEYAARERLWQHGLRPRKTILLYGPPGCGKSLGAKRLAWNTGLPLLKVRFDALISSYFGESAINLRSIFTAAKELPCVLLLDECDFIARSRTNTKDIGEASRIVNSLLQLMEDYDAPGLLVATTNIESSLDPALFRRLMKCSTFHCLVRKKFISSYASHFRRSDSLKWLTGTASSNSCQVLPLQWWSRQLKMQLRPQCLGRKRALPNHFSYKR